MLGVFTGQTESREFSPRSQWGLCLPCLQEGSNHKPVVPSIHPRSTENLKLAWKSGKPSLALDCDPLTNRPNVKTSWTSSYTWTGGKKPTSGERYLLLR